jgi:hypothetical protein
MRERISDGRERIPDGRGRVADLEIGRVELRRAGGMVFTSGNFAWSLCLLQIARGGSGEEVGVACVSPFQEVALFNFLEWREKQMQN